MKQLVSTLNLASREYGPTVTLLGVLSAVILFIAPIRTLPEDMREARQEIKKARDSIGDNAKEIATSKQALGDLAKATHQIANIMQEQSTARERLGKHDVEIEGIKERVKRIEDQMP